MNVRNKLFDFFLWWGVIGFSIWVGGTIFSMSVIVPMWSEAPPQSVRDFFGGTSFNRYIYNFFGPPWMALRNIPLIIALLLGWNSRPHRRYLLITVLCVVIAITFTFSYIYPINEKLMTQAGAGLSNEEISSMADRWILADRLRFLVMLAGYFFLLKAFRLKRPAAR